MKKITLIATLILSIFAITACGSKSIPVKAGEAEFLRDLSLSRNGVTISAPWKVLDLEQLGITFSSYDEELFKVDYMEDNVDMELDGRYQPEQGENNGVMAPSTMVIVHAFNLNNTEALFKDMTVQQLTLNRGSDSICINGDIHVGAKFSDITKKYGMLDNSYVYSLEDIDGSIYGARNTYVDILLHFQVSDDDIVSSIRLEIRKLVY